MLKGGFEQVEAKSQMTIQIDSAEKPQSHGGMIGCREMDREAEKLVKFLKGAQRAQLRGDRMLKVVSEPREQREQKATA